ncbi:SET domain-containing protein [Fragilaria crotonensis]|nr:SET domain-containing protein [Fragilaria crotonensis]
MVLKIEQKWSWWILLYAVVLVCASNRSTVTAIKGSEGYGTTGFTKLVNWVKDNGGRVDDRLGMVDAMDGAPRGCVALEDIAAGTELLFCPWNLVLGTEGDTSKVSPDRCHVLQTYADQVRLGTESFWHPYLSMDESLATRIPTVWSHAALQELQGLPPYSNTQDNGPSLTDWFSNTCAGGTPYDQLDDASRHSLLAAITRSAGMRFLPIFDLLNHHNGKLNTRSDATKHGNHLFALVDIPKGSELYLSYRGQRSTSSDIFLRYGFVEAWPQQWSWTEEGTTAMEDGQAPSPLSLMMNNMDHRILVLPSGAVAIHPSESMTLWIGSTTMTPPTLEELEDQVDRHNMLLPTTELEQFRDSAIARLETLSSVEDDVIVLYNLEQELKSMEKSDIHDGGGQSRDDDTSTTVVVTTLMDRICAIRYRINVKKAIQMAVLVANNILSRKAE